MKKVLLFIILSLSVFMLAGCGSEKKTEEKENTSTEVKETQKEETPKEIEKIDSCPDCVFFYNDSIRTTPYFAGEKRQELTDYTDDYTSFKTSNGYKAQVFMGGVLDSEGKLTKAYVCGNNDGYYCLEASTDGSTYKANVKLLKEVFGEENCSVTTSSDKVKRYDCRGENIMAIADKNGDVHVGIYSPDQGCYSAKGYGDTGWYIACR